jgi:diguanylate cyclase (GGDEF)-like protein
MMSFARLSIPLKMTAAYCVLLAALVAVSVLGMQATTSAGSGARAVEQEFGERVATDVALVMAVDGLAVAEDRLQARDPARAARLDARLARADARLAAALARLAQSGSTRDEAAGVQRLTAAHERYVAERASIVRGAGGVDALRAAFAPLRGGLDRYAGGHVLESSADVRALRDAGRDRNMGLAIAVVLALIGLAAVAGVVRSIVGRARSYAAFAGRVAAGDLDVRLDVAAGDELAQLGQSLDAMVEQLAGSAVERSRSRQDDRARRAAQDAFAEALQVTGDEPEAHGILKLHVERSVPGTDVVVLNRNNSADRLEPTTPVAGDSPLREALETAEPRSCLAVRLARTYESQADVPQLMECEICGASAQDVTCVPLLVGGEVIGSVLAEHDGRLPETDRARVEESVSRAAPVLANLRNLAIAEARAATDALTGLPNRRAVQDTLKRMLAQAGRTLTPLSAILLDLDHFKQINDTYGHEEGDVVLAAVGVALSDTLRASDFVGRNGGEEFVALLPDTDSAGAIDAAEKLRAAVAAVTPARLDRKVTASFGVATYPADATDPETLLRLADRALYAAKARGRDRVEVAAAPDHAPAG